MTEQVHYEVIDVDANGVTINVNNSYRKYPLNLFRDDYEVFSNSSNIMVGDQVYFIEPYFRMKKQPLYDMTDTSEISYLPKFVCELYPKFRSFDKGPRNCTLAFGYHLIECILFERDINLVNQLKSLIEDFTSLSILERLLTLINLNQASYDKIYYFSSSLNSIERLAREIKNRKGIRSFCNSVGIDLIIYDGKDFRPNYHSSKGSKIFEFFGVGENWVILYSREKIGVIQPTRESLNIVQSWKKFRKEYDSTDAISKEIQGICAKKQRVDKFLKLSLERLYLSSDRNAFNKVYTYLSQEGHDLNFINEIIRKNKCVNCDGNEKLINPGCEHLYCYTCFNQLIFNFLEFYRYSLQNCPTEISCPKCQHIINHQIIQSNFPQFNNYIQFFARSIRFTCNYCNKQDTQDQFTLSCHHLCNDCLVLFIRYEHNECYYCHTPFSVEEINQLKKINKKCDNCEKNFNFFKFFAKKVCNHNFCLRCCKIAYDRQKCIKNCYQFELSRFKEKDFFQNCVVCSKAYEKLSDFSIRKQCDCSVCFNCQLKVSLENCYKCKIGFGYNLKAWLQQEKKAIDERKKDCPVCYEKFDRDELIMMMKCNHDFCKNCFDGNMAAKIGACEFEEAMQCMMCQSEIEDIQLQALLGNSDSWTKISLYLIKKNFGLVECPNCHNQYDPGYNKRVKCPHCSYLFCKECFEPFHNNDCKENLLQAAIKRMEDLNDPEGVSQCPKCRTPYLKNQMCSHVECTTPNCKVAFCFKCSCIRSPTLAHGAHYHRPACEFYSKYDGNDDKVREDCTECKKTGTLCQRPNDLRKNRRIDPDEIVL